MTTIAASLASLAMAGDSRVTFYKDEVATHATLCYKLWRTRKYIVGAAGLDDDISAFKRYLETPNPGPWRRVSRKKEEFSAILLSRTSLFAVDNDGAIARCKYPFHAIGSGAICALSAMNTMARMGVDIDVRMAVEIAIDHDNESGGPVDVEVWKPIQRRSKPAFTTEKPHGESVQGNGKGSAANG